MTACLSFTNLTLVNFVCTIDLNRFLSLGLFKFAHDISQQKKNILNLFNEKQSNIFTLTILF